MRGPIVSEQLDADLGVVARVALADVVQQGAEHQQVGTVGAGDQRRRRWRRLHEVPVDGEAVVGVALRLAAHRLPLGQHVHPEARWSSASITGMARCPASSRSTSARPHVGRPRLGQRDRRCRQAVERRAVDAGVAGGRGRGRAQHEARVAGRVGVGGEVDLAVAEHQARRRSPCRAATASRAVRAATRRSAATRRRCARRSCGRRPPAGASACRPTRRRSAAATASCSSRSRRSPGRPVRRCSSTRADSSAS